MSDTLRICEVSPRDGLQNERHVSISTADKLQLIDDLVAAGLDYIELTAFVSPKAVPMMADAADVMSAVREKYPHLHATGLIFNEKGYQNAVAAGANAVALVLIVPDALSKNNSGRTAAEWMDTYTTLIQQAKRDNVWVRAYLAGAWVCPFSGPVESAAVIHYADILAEAGADELCPTDPIGHAHPAQVEALLAVMAQRYSAQRLAVHLHDTLAFGLANAYAALRVGVRTIDASLGGVGGCPFAPGAAGNLATEDLVLLADKMGLETGVSLDGLHRAINAFAPIIGRPIGGRSRAWYISCNS
jgi:hydroxymethylglutaryl-CoA lyase